jgi:hypothetical protein
MKKSHHLWVNGLLFPDVSTFQTYEPIRSWLVRLIVYGPPTGGPLRLANLLLLLFTCLLHMHIQKRRRQETARWLRLGFSRVWLRDLFLSSWFIDAISHLFESHTLIRLFSVHCNTIINNNNLSACANALWAIVDNASAQPGFNTFPICVSSVNGTLENCDLFAPVMMRHRRDILAELY